jgi:hypothetical protein
MNLRCVFHVTPVAPNAEPTPARAPMPSAIDIEIDVADEPRPRGCSIETWTRARGWASED